MKVEVDVTWSIMPKRECMSALLLILEMSMGNSCKFIAKISTQNEVTKKKMDVKGIRAF